MVQIFKLADKDSKIIKINIFMIIYKITKYIKQGECHKKIKITKQS